MTTAPPAHDDVLVLDYLASLWAAAGDLPPETRDELMNTVAGYIAMRRDLADDPSRVLGRLGPPDQLVAAVRRSGTPTHLRLPAGSVPAPDSPGGSERVAVALLTGGAIALPVVGQTAGLMIATVSPRWTPVQKVVAWLLATGPVVGALLLLVVLAGVSLFTGLGLLVIYAAACIGSIAAGLTLHGATRP
ncbi:HAAS signaling domain-containing protein [Actinoplanes xinjiangensis]|uniref:HAAS signaling domain-containing protein n=1 Tax=Actinoplanes xinjiangensis TaxID=512350 RepID=UPI003431F476